MRTSFLGIPQYHTLWWDISADQTRYGWAKCLFLVRADPDEEPCRKGYGQSSKMPRENAPIAALTMKHPQFLVIDTNAQIH